MLAVLQHLLAVDEDLVHTHRKLVWLLKSGAIANDIRVKNNDIGIIALSQHSPVLDLEILGGQGAQLMHCRCQRNQLFFPYIAPKHSSKGAVGPRMGLEFEEIALGRRRFCV